MSFIRDQCGSQWCCVTCLYLSVAGGGFLLILPPHDSTPDANVVVSNISRNGFAYQWPVSVYVWVTDGALDGSQSFRECGYKPQTSFSTSVFLRTQCRSGVRSSRTEQSTGSLCAGSLSLQPQSPATRIHAVLLSSTEPARCGDWRLLRWTCWWIASLTLAARSRTMAGSSCPHTEPSPVPQSS